MSRHLKRFSAPKHWGLTAKGHTFAVKPSPGPHAGAAGIPLLGVVRDLLGYAQDAREAKKILREGQIRVDGIVRKDHGYSAGLMDVVAIERTGEYFRILPDRKGLRMQPISDAESNVKLLRVQGKTWLGGGGLQLNLHDGSNMELPGSESKKYAVGDVIQISLPERSIKDVMKIEPGNAAIVYKGKNAGQVGVIEKITAGRGEQATLVILSADGQQLQTLESYIFVVGRKRPKIKVN